MNLWPLQNSAHRNCVQERDLHGLTKITDGAASRLHLLQWFSACSNSYHPLQDSNEAQVTIAGNICIIYDVDAFQSSFTT